MSLVAKNLTLLHNGEVFLDDISFTASPGITVLVGPTLSGKTTLMRALAGLIKTDSGSVTVNGVDVGMTSVKDRSVSFVYQQFINYPSLSVFDNIASPLRVLKPKISKEEIDTRVHEVAAMLRITELLDRKPSALSGGQQQRVAIIRSLAVNPRLLLLDEITSALDPVLVNEVLSIVRDLKHDGMTMVLATHEMGFATQVADEVCFLESGNILERGSAKDVLQNPKNPQTQEFLKRVHQAGRL